jgi:hypothetical protein
MMPVRASVLTSLTMTAIFACFVLNAALTLGSQARLMPLLVGIPGLGFSGVQLVFDLRKNRNTESQASLLEALQWRILLWLAACIPAIVLLGFDIATPLMVAAYHRFVQREKLAYLLASTCVAFVIVALVLDKLFAAQLYPGLLTPTIISWFKGL